MHIYDTVRVPYSEILCLEEIFMEKFNVAYNNL